MNGPKRKYWWRTRRGARLLRLAWDEFVKGFRSDASWVLRMPSRSLTAPKSTGGPEPTQEKPVVFLSFCAGADQPGTSRFNGGEKALNNLCHLLRRRGFEAFVVTWDGSRADWLADPAPAISVEDCRRRLAVGGSFRCVTSWIDSPSFLDGIRRFYYWDMESAYSDGYQFPEVADAVRAGRVVRFAAFSRTIQACLMARFHRPVELLPSLVDDRLWQPDESRRIRRRVGYFDEGGKTSEILTGLQERCPGAEFVRVAGIEREVIAAIQTCEFFIVMNQGKDPLWGEGGPYTPHEALACGAIPLATDICGPRESIIDGFNGFVVPRGRWDLLGATLANLLANPALCERLRENGRRHFEVALTLDARWPAVNEFLELGEAPTLN